MEDGLLEIAAGRNGRLFLFLALRSFLGLGPRGNDGQLGGAHGGRVEREAQSSVADPDNMVVVQLRCFADLDPVDLGAIGGAAVADVPALAVAVHFGVPARSVRVVENDVILTVAAQSNDVLGREVQQLR
jgi:hypothetical protein